ncbi:MAG TPA: hypothetical protein VFW11_01485 [Cyclobacteriaceae bacterium]|nr:hypothetical protein [Cyclobacteriaceae bacterium]
MKCISTIIILTGLMGYCACSQMRKTSVSIVGEDFYINDLITLKGKTYQGVRLEGLLPNSRMVQGIFDDYNEETQHLWIYPDTKKWDADRNTNEFVNAMSNWKAHGLLAFTINLQGGSPFGYSSGSRQRWINSAFKSDGSLDDRYVHRLEKILDKADELGMVVILGYFYFGQDQNLNDEEAVQRAVRNATTWILDKGYRNVMIELNNECDINDLANRSAVDPYDHAILDYRRVHELINLVKSIRRDDRRLLVSASFKGGAVPSDNVLESADFVLIHGNGVHQAEGITSLITAVRERPAYKAMPIVINEDDHFDFDKAENNFMAATRAHVSWGYFDYRMKDEKFEDGYQSVPVDWGMNADRKKAFFNLLKEMTK